MAAEAGPSSRGVLEQPLLVRPSVASSSASSVSRPRVGSVDKQGGRFADVVAQAVATERRNPPPHLAVTSQFTSRSRKEKMRTNQAVCREWLDALSMEDGDTEQFGEIDQFMEPLLNYKNKYFRACLLHYAVVFEAESEEGAGSVRRVLEARASLDTLAEVAASGVDWNRTRVMAIHIAAGMGCVPALDALLEETKRRAGPSPDEQQKACRKLVDLFCWLGDEPYYSPLHEAAYEGRPKALEWLLNNGADPWIKNSLGLLPIHFVAWRGHKSDEVVEEMVGILLKAGKVMGTGQLDAATAGEGFLPRNLVPLEVATLSGSQFPRRMLYLLAPSFRPQSLDDEHSFFADLFTVSRRSMEAAEALVSHILKSDKMEAQRQQLRENMWRYSTDEISKLFYFAPMAAADVLKILTVSPKVKDWARQPINSRTCLNMLNRYMKCTYQPDWEWRWDSTKRPGVPQPEHDWHMEFMPDVPLAGARRRGIYDVAVKVVKFPNLLNLDVVWSLALTLPMHIRLFANLPVQGLITCFWDELIAPLYFLNLAGRFFDLVVFISLGLTSCGTLTPRLWALFLSGALVETKCLISWLWRHLRRCWRNPTLWNTYSIWSCTVFGYDCVTVIFQFWVVFLMSDNAIKAIGIVGSDILESTLFQYVLSASVILQSFKLIYMLRVCGGIGAKVFTIARSFLSGAVTETIGLMVLIFLAFFFPLWMLHTAHSSDNYRWLWALITLYRAILGDGDGLDVGLQVDNDREAAVETGDDGATRYIMLVATFLFYVIILNLIVAVYGNEYDRVERESMLYFHKERAKYSVIAVMSSHDIPNNCPSLVLGLELAIPLLIGSGCVVLYLTHEFLPCVGAAVCIALARILCQNVWCQHDQLPAVDTSTEPRGNAPVTPEARIDDSEELTSRRRTPFTGLLHSANGNLQAGIIRSMSLRVSQLLRNRRGFMGEPGVLEAWADRVHLRFRDRRQSRGSGEHFLWICHRSDYDDEKGLGGGDDHQWLELKQSSQDLNAKLDTNRAEHNARFNAVDVRLNRLGQAVGGVERKLDLLLDAIGDGMMHPRHVREPLRRATRAQTVRLARGSEDGASASH